LDIAGGVLSEKNFVCQGAGYLSCFRALPRGEKKFSSASRDQNLIRFLEYLDPISSFAVSASVLNSEV